MVQFPDDLRVFDRDGGAVAVAQQDADEFRSLLEQALAIDPDADLPNRLLNLISQARARWLLQEIDEYFWDNNDN